ncbi:MAG: hypothetical protein AAF542_19395 [Pseudomonadota bacterium]
MSVSYHLVNVRNDQASQFSEMSPFNGARAIGCVPKDALELTQPCDEPLKAICPYKRCVYKNERHYSVDCG